MTDLEQALDALAQHGATIRPHQVDAVIKAIAAARREGAAWMRERAAAATAFCCFECSRVIRVLPLTPEEPQV